MTTQRKEFEMWEAVERYLAGIGHRLDTDFEIRKLSGGSANLNYLISTDGNKAVLRRPPGGPLPPGANDVAREYKVLSQLGDAFPAAPKGLVYCGEDSVIGVPFCICEFREGICIGRHLPQVLDGQEGVGSDLSQLVVNTLSEFHRVDTERVGLSDLGKIDGFLERQVAGWFKRGQRELSVEQQVKLSVMRDWLSERLPEKRPGCLVHNDFKLDNMLVDPESLVVTGVLDWDMCTIGDPFYELAILLSYWGGKSDPYVYSYQARMPCEADGWWTRREVLNRYLSLSGQQLGEDELAFYWWLVQYRTVVVYAQLHAMFQRTGERPTALTEDECEAMESFIDKLLCYAATNLGILPESLRPE